VSEHQEKKKVVLKNRLDNTLKEIQEREHERYKQAEEWKKIYHEYNVHKPLYQVKEEEFEKLMNKEEQEKQDFLSKRANIFKSNDDNFFAEWRKEVEKKQKELQYQLKQKRMSS
jgi:hypothetical protein